MKVVELLKKTVIATERIVKTQKELAKIEAERARSSTSETKKKS